MKTKNTVILSILTFWDLFYDRVKKARTSHGPVNYKQASSSRKHFIPELGLYAGKAFQYGNRKLARNVAIFSLLELLSCLNCKDCAKGCYAKKASRQYATAYIHRLLYFWLACNNMPLLKSIILQDLQRLPAYITCVRIHEAGDFVSQDYVNMWRDIAASRPDIVFYFYTKTGAIFDFSGLLALNNVSMIDSVLPCGGKNFGDADYVAQQAAAIPGAYVCRYGAEDAPECGSGCTFCMTPGHCRKYVLFHDHSANKTATGKKARKASKTA